jgi:hypothetical protein
MPVWSRLRGRLATAGLVVGTVYLVGAGCGTPPVRIEPDRAEYPTRLRSPAELDGDFAMEQSLTVQHETGEHRFRAVLQKVDAEIVLVGLGPHGGRGFALTQRGTEVTFETFVPVELPFRPEYMLYDVHRTWLQPSPDPAPPPGVRAREQDGERVTERWSAEGLVERTFERLDGRPTGVLAVRYEPPLANGAPLQARPPSRAHLDNGWFGYRIEMETDSWTPLSPEAPEAEAP